MVGLKNLVARWNMKQPASKKVRWSYAIRSMQSMTAAGIAAEGYVVERWEQ